MSAAARPVCLLLLLAARLAGGHTVLVSGYSDQLTVVNLTAEGGLARVGARQVESALTWLQLEGDTVWAAHEVETWAGQPGGAVSRWQLDRSGAGLTKVSTVRVPGAGPAHLLLSRDLGLAFTANYGGSSWTVFRLGEAGLESRPVLHQQFPACSRGPARPHQTVVRGDWVWVVDLGCDTIRHYRAVGGGVAGAGQTAVRAGAGPRHLALHPTQPLAFLVCELTSLLVVYRLNPSTGGLEELQQLPLSPHPEDYGAEVVVSEDGRTVYASSRGTGVILVYRLAGEQLGLVQELQLAGTWPRHFALRGKALLVADQHGASLQALTVREDGMLESGDMVSTADQPAFVLFIH